MFFYIVDPDPVVRLDLADTIRSRYGESETVMDAAVGPLPPAATGRDVIMVINGSLVTDALAEMLGQGPFARTRRIFVGAPATARLEGIAVDVPFTQEMVLHALAETVAQLSSGEGHETS